MYLYHSYIQKVNNVNEKNKAIVNWYLKEEGIGSLREEKETVFMKFYYGHPNYRKKKLAQNSDYQKNHLKEIEAKHRDRHHERRMKAFELLGGKCANPFNLPHPDWCNDWRCLQIDHINGGGCEHHKKRKAQGIISDVIKDPDRKLKYQLLCANCNWIKRFKDKEHN
jgi:hypothetical protein